LGLTHRVRFGGRGLRNPRTKRLASTAASNSTRRPDSKEEYLCACELEKWATRGRIEFWVRNLVRKPCSSFFLQTAEGRFYPDFVCRLPGQTVLVVEYKGADRYAAAKMDRDMGDLWASGPRSAAVPAAAEGARPECLSMVRVSSRWGISVTKQTGRPILMT